MQIQQRAIAALIAAMLIGLAMPLSAQKPKDPSGENVVSAKGTPQEKKKQETIEDLRKRQDPYYVIRNEVLEHYKTEGNRPKLLELLKDKDLPGNVFTGIALVFAESDDRSALTHTLRAFADNRFKESESTVRNHAIMDLHKTQSILPEISALLAELLNAKGKAPKPGFKKVLALVPELVQPELEDRTDRERYQAVEFSLDLWQAAPKTKAFEEARILLARYLTEYVDRAVVFTKIEDWQNWFAPYRKEKDEEKLLSMEPVYADLVTRLRSENTELRDARREAVKDLISRMKAQGEPPTKFLSDRDSSLRQIAFVTFRSMADALEPERRSQAITDLIAGLKQKNLASRVFKNLLSAAGPLAQKATTEDKTRLVAAIFDAGANNSQDILQSRLKAVGEVGLLDQEERLRDLYDLANGPKRQKNEGWVAVRLATVKLAQKLGKNAPLVVRALQDSDSEVRGIAAVVIGVDNKTWNDEVLKTLTQAAQKESDPGTQGRLLDTVNVIATKQAELLSAERVSDLLTLPYATTENHTSARLAAILKTFQKNGAALEAQKPKALALMTQCVGEKDAAQRKRLFDVMAAHPSALLLEPLIAWFGEEANLADPSWDAVQGLVFTELQRGKTWGPHIVKVWRTLEAASKTKAAKVANLSSVALDAVAKLGRVPEPLTMNRMVEQHEEWVLESTDETLWQKSIDRRNAAVKANPNDGAVLEKRAVLNERLAHVWTAKRTELLQAAKTDLNAALKAKNGAEADALKLALQIDLARVSFLLGESTELAAALAAIEKVAPTDPNVVWLKASEAAFRQAGQAPLKTIDALPEQIKKASPKTMEWLRCACLALSQDMADWDGAVQVLPADAGKNLKDLLNAQVALKNKIATILKARLEGKIAPEEEKLVPTETKTLAHAAANRALELIASDKTKAKRLSDLLVNLTKNKKLAWPKKVTDETTKNLVAELKKQETDKGTIKKLRIAFLKKVGAHLYSLD